MTQGMMGGLLDRDGVAFVTSGVTFDPTTAANVALSNGNLTATNTGTIETNQGVMVAAASGKNSGKYYYEIIWVNIFGIGGANVGSGIGTTTSTYTGLGNNATVGGILFRGAVYANGAGQTVYPGPFNNGDVTAYAIDLDNLKFWVKDITNAGGWNASGTADPASNTGGFALPAGIYVPVVVFGGGGGQSGIVMTANFGASPFTGAVPTGFNSGWTP